MQIRFNPSVIRHMPVALSLPVALFLLLLIWLAGTAPKLNAEPLAPATHYVAPGGDCGGAAPCYATIQAAVDAAPDGDTIKVAQGTYRSSDLQVVYINRAITLAGGYSTTDWLDSHPDTQPSVIDAENVPGRRGIRLGVVGTAIVVIEGLTIQNGFAVSQGGGIFITDGTVQLRQLVVRNSTAGSGNPTGGGIKVLNGDVSVDNCTIEGNSAGPSSGQGGGIYIEDGRLLVKNSVFRQNFAYMGGGVSSQPALIWTLSQVCSRTIRLGHMQVAHWHGRDTGLRSGRRKRFPR